MKDLKSAIHDLSILLDGFEKKNKKAAPSQAGKPQAGSVRSQVPLLTGLNFDALCGETNPVCIIGAFRSPKASEKLEFILSMVSRKFPLYDILFCMEEKYLVYLQSTHEREHGRQS